MHTPGWVERKTASTELFYFFLFILDGETGRRQSHKPLRAGASPNYHTSKPVVKPLASEHAFGPMCSDTTHVHLSLFLSTRHERESTPHSDISSIVAIDCGTLDSAENQPPFNHATSKGTRGERCRAPCRWRV